MTEHIHHYNWIVSWKFEIDGNLVFSIEKFGNDMHAKEYFCDVPDVKTGIKQCELAIDYYRDGHYELGHKYWNELRDKLRELKYPPSKHEALITDNNDYIPF